MTHAERAHQYAEDVCAGKIPACKWVRLACKRHIDDLKRAKSTDWPFTYDAAKAERVCVFGEKLPHVKGKWARKDPKTRKPSRIKLEPAQCFILCSLFGWVKKSNGMRRFKFASVYVPRKNAKSTLACIIGWWMFAKDDEPGAEVYSGATSEKQAWEVFGPARQMAVSEPLLAEGLGVTVNAKSLVRLADNCKFEPVIGKPGDGASPHLAIVDEYHEHPDATLYDTMKTGMGAREQPMVLIISTAGDNLAGPCKSDWDDCQKLLAGIIEEDTHFAIIWTIDLEPDHYSVMEGDALSCLYNICVQYAVPFTLINDRSREVFAAAAIPVIDAPISPSHASTTPTEPQDAEGSALPATSNLCSTVTQTERVGETNTSSSGPRAIGTRREQHKSGGAPDLKTPQQSSHKSAKANTEYLPESIAPDTRCREASAGFANRNETSFAWIIATLRARFGDFYASNATARSVFSEILSRACSALCDTSGIAQLVKPLDSLGLEVRKPADDWTSEAALAKANPLWGISVNPEIILPDIKAAMRDPHKQATVKTKHLNLWVTAAKGWLNLESWKKCGDSELSIDGFAGKPCWLGLDAASKVDMTCLTATFRTEKGYAVFSKNFMPEDTVNAPENRHYQAFASKGWLVPTPGARVDFTIIEDQIREWAEKFNVQSLGYDPKELNDFINRVRLWAGFDLVEITQAPALISEPMKELEAQVASGTYQHENDECLTWMFSNVVKKEARGGGPVKYYYPTKEKPQNKIDGAVSSIMGLRQAMMAPAESGGVGVSAF